MYERHAYMHVLASIEGPVYSYWLICSDRWLECYIRYEDIAAWCGTANMLCRLGGELYSCMHGSDHHIERNSVGSTVQKKTTALRICKYIIYPNHALLSHIVIMH